MFCRSKSYPVFVVFSVCVLALTSVLAVAGATQVKRVGNLYQWVDDNGRVVYGDSPPTVTRSRKVSDDNIGGVQRQFQSAAAPRPVETTKKPSQEPPRSPTEPRFTPDQIAALGRLNPTVAQAMSHVTARAESQVGAAVVDAEPAVYAPGMASDTGPGDPTTRLAGSIDQMPRAPTPANAGVVSAGHATLSAASADLPTVPAQINHSSSASIVEVSHTAPQLIETELSERELIRMRQRSHSVGERRFLERVKRLAADAESSNRLP